MSETSTALYAECSVCKRGAEACEYCSDLKQEDWQAICDCGLEDFGEHLLDCESRAEFRFRDFCDSCLDEDLRVNGEPQPYGRIPF